MDLGWIRDGPTPLLLHSAQEGKELPPVSWLLISALAPPPKKSRFSIVQAQATKHWATFPDEILCCRIILMKMSPPVLSIHLSVRARLLSHYCSRLTSFVQQLTDSSLTSVLLSSHKRSQTQVRHCQFCKGRSA